MPKFLCTYKSPSDRDIYFGFNSISEVVTWLRDMGESQEYLNPKVYIDIGEHKYLQIIVYFAE